MNNEFTFSKAIKWFITEPIIIGLLALAAILFFTSPEDLSFIKDSVGGGLVVKIINAIIAGLVLMFLVKVATKLRVLIADGKLNGIETNPVAKAVLMSGLYIAFAFVVANSFG